MGSATANDTAEHVIGIVVLNAAEHVLCPTGQTWRGILTELLDGDAVQADQLIFEARRQLQDEQEANQ